jgi:hypothetical protein
VCRGRCACRGAASAPRDAQQPRRALQTFFADERSKGRAYSELYELVQHAGNVLPRL